MAVIFWILTTISLLFFAELLIHIVKAISDHDHNEARRNLIKSLDRLNKDVND